MTKKLIRKVQKSGLKDKYDKGKIVIPDELGFEPQDIILFEKIDDTTAKMIKIA